MGVDYQARKAAKKNRQREAELKPRRERKKKQARRLCRGPCYQDPGLTADDLEEAGSAGLPSRAAAAPAGELARFAQMDFGDGPSTGSDKKQGGKKQGSAEKRKRGAAASPAAAGQEQDQQQGKGGGQQAAKRPKLSTAVNLLDARTAKTEAPRQKQLPPGAVSEELQQFPELLQRFMAGEGFPDPMPIQMRCWPLLLAGRDVQALAEPGSGKTIAYLLPAAEVLVQNGHCAGTHPDGPIALVLLPTRELAQQVATVCRDLRKYSGLRTACITGGADRQQQVEMLGKQPHIVVATPGRLIDLVQDGTLQLAHVRYVVLDEADKMLGLGFQPQIDALKALLLPPPAAVAAAQEGSKKPKKARRVQVGLFTATMPEDMDEVAAAWLHRPEHICIHASAASISKSVSQVVQVCAEHKKPAKLAKHLQNIQEASKGLRNPPRVLIFANRIKTVRFLHKLVADSGLRTALLHGERSQEEREAAMADFRSGKAQVLVATDVAARGLHIRNLPYVVNYDFPPNLEQYVHRVGRTGRLATDGHAFSFFTREMARLAPPLVKLLQQHNQALDPNLIKLKEAFEIAAEKLGLLADATGNAPAVPQKEDVLRNLGMKTQQQKKKDRQQQRQAAKKGASAAAAEEESESEEAGSSDEEAEEAAPAVRGHGGQRGGEQPPASASQQQAQREAPADEREEPPFFVPSKTFRGARPGYAFKKGQQGVGYYLDSWSQQRLRQQQQAGGSGKKRKQADTAKQAQKQEFQDLKKKYTHAPIGGRGSDSSKPAASAKARREQQQQAEQQQPPPQRGAAAEKQQAQKASAAPALLPGRLKELRRQKQQLAAQGRLSGYSSSEDEGPAPLAAVPASKRLKALPGRLRKKLAKERSAKD